MTTLPKELSPERCLQLRQGGFIRVLVNLLQEHTSELQNKPEADFNIELFLMNFNGKAELRARLSHQLRTIVEHTSTNEHELKILGWLETIRSYVKRLYNFMVGWKAMTEDPSKLTECTDQLTQLAGQVKKAIEESLTLTNSNDAIRPIFEQFGGVFVIVDYLRAQTRCNAKCHQFEPDQIDTSPLLRVAEDSKLVLRYAVAILYKLVTSINSSNDDMRLFLANSRSLHEIMVDIVEDAYDHDDLKFVRLYCHLLYSLYNNFNLHPSTSHLKDCGVIKCLAKFGMKIKKPKTLYCVTLVLAFPLSFNRQNVLEFVSIDGSVDMLIDVLVPSKDEDEDVENAKWYKDQRYNSIAALYNIHYHLMTQDHMDGRLLTIYESRDFAAILLRYLVQITPIDEDSRFTEPILELLRDILVSSEYQRWKFTEIGNGKEVVRRFETSDNEDFARLSKQIGEMFE